MAELKTLKDITEKEWDIEVTPEEYFVTIENLKQEAIKWIKLTPKCRDCKNYKNGECWINDEFQSKIDKNSIMKHCFQSEDGFHFKDININFIKYFFNIAEEDLR